MDKVTLSLPLWTVAVRMYFSWDMSACQVLCSWSAVATSLRWLCSKAVTTYPGSNLETSIPNRCPYFFLFCSVSRCLAGTQISCNFEKLCWHKVLILWDFKLRSKWKFTSWFYGPENHVIVKVITALSEEPVTFVVRVRHFITVQHRGCVYSYRLASIAMIDGLQ